jgi:hypothetical protein
MRINELNAFQNFISNVTGAIDKARQPSLAKSKTAQSAQAVAAAAKRGEQSGLGTEDQLAMDTFVERFVSRGSNALNTAIKQNLVDVTSTNFNPPGQQNQQSQTQPGAQSGQAQAGQPQPGQTQAGQPQPGQTQAGQTQAGQTQAGQTQAGQTQAGQTQAGQTQPAPNASKQNTGIDANVKKISRSMNQLQPTGTKPIPKKAAQEIATDLPKVSLNKDYLVRVGEKILKLNSVGYDVKDFHKQFMDQYKTGTRAKSIQESIGHERLTEIYRKLSTQEKFRRSLKRAGYDPDEAAKRIRDLLKKQQQEREQYRDVYKDLGVDIDKYKVDENTAAPPAAGATNIRPSIGEWFRDNFMKNFLRGIDLGTSQQQVDDILKDMPNLYKSGKLDQALTDIANIAWAVSDQGRKQDK